MALSSDLAGVFQIILAQQEAEARKERDQQQTALTLLSMEMQGRGYEDALVGQYGGENLIEDPGTGRLRVRTESEGFNLELTPEYKLKELTADLEADRLDKATALQYNIRTLDRKIEREAETKQRIRTKYPTLDPKYLTPGGPDIINTFDKVSEDENNDIRSEIKSLSTDIAALNALEQELAGQAVYYETERGGFEGANLILDPQEFEVLTQEYREKYPDRPIAGLTQAYAAGKVGKARRYEFTQAVQEESKKRAQGNLLSIQKMMSTEDFDFTGIEGAEDDEVMKSQMLQAVAFDNYSDFLSFLDREPTGEIKKAFYSLAPGVMRAMEEHSEEVASLRSEFLGIDEEAQTKALLDEFKSDIRETKTTKEAFSIYQDYFEDLPGRKLKQEFFGAMEEEIGKGDLYPTWKGWLKNQGVVDPSKSARISQSELVLKPFEGEAGTVEETAQNVYDALDQITSPEATSDMRSLTLNLSTRGAQDVPGKGIIERPNYSAGKAVLGGQLGFDSPYYDAFYDSVDESLKELVQEEDPWGPDWLVYGLPEEHMAPEIIKERFGLDVYNKAVEAADKIGREAQIKAIGAELKKKSGEDYYDLVRILNSI